MTVAGCYMNQKTVTTFANSKYIDAIRLVIYDFVSCNVGTRHVSSLIASVLRNLADVEFGRLPKETVVKLRRRHSIKEASGKCPFQFTECNTPYGCNQQRAASFL